MPIIITYLSERVHPDIVEGESWTKLDSDSPRLGSINLKSLEDGHRIIINKNAVAKVEEFSSPLWEGMVAKEKEQREIQKKAQIRAQAQGQVKAWHAQPWWKKLFRECPITLPADLAEKKA